MKMILKLLIALWLINKCKFQKPKYNKAIDDFDVDLIIKAYSCYLTKNNKLPVAILIKPNVYYKYIIQIFFKGSNFIKLNMDTESIKSDGFVAKVYNIPVYLIAPSYVKDFAEDATAVGSFYDLKAKVGWSKNV